MARIAAIKGKTIAGDAGEDITEISYITGEVKHALRKLPPFESVTGWQEDLRGV